jgi:hypothetical protein
MANELEIRAQIDTENVKALLLINGGAAVALLAFLGSMLGTPGCELLTRAILWALLTFQFGLVSAVINNRLRRKCSMVYQAHQYRPPKCEIFGKVLAEPCICMWSILFMWGSVLFFVGGSVLVFLGGLDVVGVCGAGSDAS